MRFGTMEMHTIEVAGTFLGHIYFGILFTVWALVWIGEELAQPSLDPLQPLERGLVLPVLKIVLPLVGSWFEIPNRGWDPDDFMMGWAHMAAYVPFAFVGGVDLLARRGIVPTRAGFLAFAAALLNAAFVFWGHDSHGGVPGAAHSLLVIALVATAAIGLFELAHPGRGAGWFRRGSLLGLGTWLLVLTWVLYRSGWDMADPIRVSWVYVLFSWNAIVVSLAVSSVAVVATRMSDGDVT